MLCAAISCVVRCCAHCRALEDTLSFMRLKAHRLSCAWRSRLSFPPGNTYILEKFFFFFFFFFFFRGAVVLWCLHRVLFLFVLALGTPLSLEHQGVAHAHLDRSAAREA